MVQDAALQEVQHGSGGAGAMDADELEDFLWDFLENVQDASGGAAAPAAAPAAVAPAESKSPGGKG
jgi:hypothetical protein